MNAQGSTGYTVAKLKSTVPYTQRVADFVQANKRATVVIVEGSRNDAPSDPVQVKQNAAYVLSAVKTGIPTAKIVVIGPIWDSTVPPATTVAANEQVKQVAKDLGLTYVDAIAEGWLTGKTDLIGSYHVHPTNAGHVLLEQIIDTDLRRLGVFS